MLPVNNNKSYCLMSDCTDQAVSKALRAVVESTGSSASALALTVCDLEPMT